MVEVMSPAVLREAADAARDRARRLRTVSSARRAELRRTRDAAHSRHTTYAATLDLVGRTRDLRYRSTWSDLPWQPPDRALEIVLVSIDGDT